MSDISQHGLICTLQRLNENAALGAELRELSRQRRTVLILPCHGDDLQRPALRRVAGELSRADFLAEVVIPVNGVDKSGFAAARELLSETLKVPHRVLWCDAVEAPLREELGAFRPGKGSNVWLATGCILREQAADFLLAADADVVSFQLEMVARLAYALAHPELGFAFAKSYYPRVTDRIYGRVTRLFLGPLLQAVVRTCGHRPLLGFLGSFRYPLAGEFGFAAALGGALPFEEGWGLEVGMLCDVFRRIDPRQVCQVDAGLAYDHKHQPLGDGERGLIRMCREVAQVFFHHLQREGVKLEPSFFEAVELCYKKEAAEAVRRSSALAKINGLRHDGSEEAQLVAAFQGALREAVRGYVHTPEPLPEWDRASARLWDIADEVPVG